MTLFLTVLLLGAVALGGRYWVNRQRTAGLLASALSVEQRALVETQVPLVLKLPPELRGKLEGKINLFLNQVEFVGCNGLEVSEEMRVSIAAQACLLVVNSDAWYEHLNTVLIYPDAFKSMQTRHSGYVVVEREIVRTGESWLRGPVILSWAHSQQGAINATDGHNVVFHEFAHQIDDLSGRTDGVPNLGKNQTFSGWERVFVAAYKRHVRHVQARRRTVIDPYGAEGYEEFFAVSVEVFFERAAALKHAEPEVYEQLSQLFQLDPSSW